MSMKDIRRENIAKVNIRKKRWVRNVMRSWVENGQKIGVKIVSDDIYLLQYHSHWPPCTY